MAEGPDEIERDIDIQSGRLRENLEQLEDKVRSAMNWETYYGKYPWALLGAAFVGGMVLSKAGSRHSRHYAEFDNPATYAGVDTTYGGSLDDGDSGVEFGANGSRKRAFTSTVLPRIGAALAAVATNKLQDALDQIIPGFRDEYDRHGGKGKQS